MNANIYDCPCWLLENTSSSSGTQERKLSWFRIIDIVALLHWCRFRKYPLSEEGGTQALFFMMFFYKVEEFWAEGSQRILKLPLDKLPSQCLGTAHSAALWFLPPTPTFAEVGGWGSLVLATFFQWVRARVCVRPVKCNLEWFHNHRAVIEGAEELPRAASLSLLFLKWHMPKITPPGLLAGVVVRTLKLLLKVIFS